MKVIMKNKRFWNWTDSADSGRTLTINGTISEESWFDDDVTPELFRNELTAGGGDITACEVDSDFVLREISFPEGVLAVMIKRGSNTIIPNGDTSVQKNDVVVVNNI